MQATLNTETPNSKSLMAEWRELAAAKEPLRSEAEKAQGEAEKAAALREYQRLVDMIDDVLKELQRTRAT